MKAVILAGGKGTRISEESHLRPKPMIEIGGRPILWHIMNIYAHHGITDFVIALGYRGHMIKEYFSNYVLYSSDVTVDTGRREVQYHHNYAEPWRVTMVDTGLETQTGGRLKRLARYLDPDESFCMTYGDGVANVDIASLIKFHNRHGKRATVTAVVPPGRYGALVLDGDRVDSFIEKPPGDNAFINGGFFVLHPDVRELRSSEVDEHTLPTLVRRGATIGANCTIGCDLTIGEFAMVGMGSVITRDVPDHALVIGDPARVVGLVCRCGEVVHRFAAGTSGDAQGTCAACARPFSVRGGAFVAVDVVETA